MRHLTSSLLALVLGAALTTAPAWGQGKGKGAKPGKDREVERYVERWERGRDGHDARRAGGNGAGKVPPGWCRGEGNPHNTVENCGYRSSVDRRYRGRAGSFEAAHREFHYHHDRQCRIRAAERPLDPLHQVRVRAACAAEHRRWHARYDPDGRH